MIELLRGAWRFRDFILASVKREFASRYLGTQLGFFWAILQPLALILIYTLVFAEVMKPRLPGHESRFAYSIYLTAGLITWMLFSDLLARAVGIFVHNATLLKKVNIHKLSFPIIASISALVQSGILIALFLLFLGFSGNLPGAPLLGLIPVIAIAGFLAMGLGLFLATVNVFYRDVEQGIGLTLQFLFWMTPIVYPATALPGYAQSILAWNPMWPVVRAAQDIFVENRFPDWATLVYPLALALALAVLAKVAFERLGGELVDEL
jgi:lipopolysaccharide transport system permease protein